MPAVEVTDRAPVASLSFDLWGGVATVATVERAGLPAALGAVERVVVDFDRACSTFRQDSELSAVNRGAGGPVRVGPILAEAIDVALKAAVDTDGDVDPTVGLALVAHGLHDANGLTGPIRIEAAPGIRAVRLDRGAGTVAVARGVRLDLGATAKALAADHAAVAAREAAGCGVLVSLLGDIATAGPPPEAGWQVRVTDDHRGGPQARGQTVSLRAGAIATSSVTVRRSTAAHHLIDPRTGTPARPYVRTATVAAGSCLDANVASTAAIIRGARATRWLDGRRLAARLVATGGTTTYVGGWPSGGDQMPTTGTCAA